MQITKRRFGFTLFGIEISFTWHNEDGDSDNYEQVANSLLRKIRKHRA